MWLPVPRQETLNIQVVAEEPRYVAFRDDHPLAGRATVAFEELLTEAFIALPETAAPYATSGSLWTNATEGPSGSARPPPTPTRPSPPWRTAAA
ncbi:LysR substrate-binding domain-containing protein [Actinomadura madurae]|uniref:LysR substrate-binding domain-containing protein n=1 Tax=Actinomadura madurae TaxID=1993 RepID=UPI0020D25C6F|nr:LysR substrate-binding domain-containing protein [Actinomadura madurae]MCP9980627.1 LysR substrate-binding domain-containing protein [Actinomadura madurae]